MSGLYDNYNATDAANKYVDTNSMYQADYNKPLDYNWQNEQMPGMSGMDTSDVPEYNAGLFNYGKNNFTAAGFGDIVGGLGGLYGMYQGNKMMGLAKDDMNMRKQSYTDARNDRNNFLSDTKTAFSRNA